MITIKRMLRSINFFYDSTELKFDDFSVSVSPIQAIGETYNPSMSLMFTISFVETTTQEIGETVVVVTSKKTSDMDDYSPYINKKGSSFRRKSYQYEFTSYLAMGTFSLVPPIHCNGVIKLNEELQLQVGKTYLVYLTQHENKVSTYEATDNKKVTKK